MVNTFLVTTDFHQSAKYLNKQRLGKQRVEAYQILLNLYDLEILSQVFKIPKPIDPTQYKTWVTKINTEYKSCGGYLFFRQGQYYWIEKSRYMYKVDKNKDTVHQQDNGSYLVISKNGNQSTHSSGSIILPDDRLSSYGFKSHPALIMWIGYIPALQAYINAHIDEWVSRGCKNNMKRYSIPDHIEYPPWIYDHAFHFSHKGSLYIKEIKRNEPAWYQLMIDFVQAGQYYLSLSNSDRFEFYIWPNTNKLY